MLSKNFWSKTGERAVKSFAQALVAILGANQVGLFEAHWLSALSAAGMATVLSVLTSVGGAGIGPADDPSLVGPKTAVRRSRVASARHRLSRAAQRPASHETAVVSVGAQGVAAA
jgi:Putative lactococcus lactis phage r1t holin